MRVLSNKELDEFIEDAERMGSDTWWVSEFCDEAVCVAEELKLRREARKEEVDARTDW